MRSDYTLGLYEKSMPSGLDWRQKLEAAKAAGFDFLEISIDETDEKLGRLDMDRDRRLELVQLMYETGLPIRSMCLSGHRRFPLGSRDPLIRERSMEIMAKAIRLADDLGIRIIQLAGYDVYYEDSGPETRKYFAENLQKAVDMAARSAVMLGFETMETPFMNTVEKSLAYVRRSASAYLSVYPDVGNLTNAALEGGTDVLEDIRSGRGQLAAMHLKETLPGVFREVPFGEGHVDFPSAVNAAWESGVRRFVAEFWYTGGSGWRDDLSKVNRWLRGIVDCRE